MVLGGYFFAFGFSLSKNTLLAFFERSQLDMVDKYFVYIPYFLELKGFTIDRLALNSGGLATWWTMVVGIPLMLLGITALMINFFTFISAMFDYVYNLTHCPWYEWHKLTMKKLKKGRNYQRK